MSIGKRTPSSEGDSVSILDNSRYSPVRPTLNSEVPNAMLRLTLVMVLQQVFRQSPDDVGNST
jgi:hypothetical protein